MRVEIKCKVKHLVGIDAHNREQDSEGRGGKNTFFLPPPPPALLYSFAQLSKSRKRKRTLLSINVFRSKVLTGDTIFTSPTGDGTAISTWSSEPREGPAVCSEKAVPSFLSYFNTSSVGPPAGIEPATSRSAVKRSTD